MRPFFTPRRREVRALPRLANFDPQWLVLNLAEASFESCQFGTDSESHLLKYGAVKLRSLCHVLCTSQSSIVTAHPLARASMQQQSEIRLSSKTMPPISYICPTFGKELRLTGVVPTCEGTMYEYQFSDDGDRLSWRPHHLKSVFAT